MTLNDKQKILKFCTSVEKGFGSIVDANVKKEYERLYEGEMSIVVLAELLSVLEELNLMDKKNSVNKDPFFYRKMRAKI